MRGVRDPDRRAKLLRALSEGHSVRKAAELAGIPHREQVYVMAKTDQELAKVLKSRRKTPTGRGKAELASESSQTRELALQALKDVLTDGEAKHADRIKAAVALLNYTAREATANYSVDKGWIAALDHFAQCIGSGATPENAGAADGLAASALAQAAIESRESQRIVEL